MKPIRKALAWTLYGVADALSNIMCAFDWSWIYPAYNWLMVTSSTVQGNGDGPWEQPQ